MKILLLLLLLTTGKSLSQRELIEGINFPKCEDSLVSKVVIDPKIADRSPFFRKTTKSYPWHIVDHGNGKLEDTLDGVVDAKDRIKIEHTAHCFSNHQGKHAMLYCDAKKKDKVLTLTVYGEWPAYHNFLTIVISNDSSVKCKFAATFVSPSSVKSWKITKKSIQLERLNVKPGERQLGWLSVEFEKITVKDGKTVKTPYKIEGFFKPILEQTK